jgi:hypothetical protein
VGLKTKPPGGSCSAVLFSDGLNQTRAIAGIGTGAEFGNFAELASPTCPAVITSAMRYSDPAATSATSIPKGLRGYCGGPQDAEVCRYRHHYVADAYRP